MTMVILLSSPAPKPLQLHVRFNQKIFAHGSAKAQKTCKHSMFLKTKPVVKDGVLSFDGYHALKGIPDNVVVTPWTNSSLFLGATSTHSSSRHVFKLGELE